MRPEVTYSGLVIEALGRYPDRVAFVHGDRRVSYAEAADRVSRLRAQLAECGVALGVGVAALSPTSPESWFTQAACYLAGGRFTGLQAQGSLDDHVYVCDDAEISVLVVPTSHADQGREILERATTVRHLLVLGSHGEATGASTDRVRGELSVGPSSADDVAWLQYTGGSTGRPKGVMLTQRSLVHQTLSHLASWGIPEQPRYLAAASIVHASGLPVLPVLLRGGTVVLMSGFDPDSWLRTVQDERINYAFVVPTMLYGILDQASPERFDLESLETMNYGGAPTSPTRLLEAMERIGPVFHQVYGQTEIAGTATSLRHDEHDPRRPELLGSCGRAVVGAEVALLDLEGAEVPAGDAGEVCVRTRAAMAGYRNRPEETAEVLRDGWVHTGDMGRRDDRGFFYLVDRKKDMIISGGYNIYSREVEVALEDHPAIEAVAVIGVPDERWGEAVCAVVVRRAGETTSEAELLSHVRGRKGGIYTPKAIKFTDQLPMTVLGKVDKKALPRTVLGWSRAREIH